MIEVRVLNTSRFYDNFSYRFLKMGDDYYLLPLHQGFIRDFLFFANWYRPIRLYRLSEEDVRFFSKNFAVEKNGPLKRMFGTFFGLSIGTTLYHQIDSLMINPEHRIFWLIFFILGVAIIKKIISSIKLKKLVKYTSALVTVKRISPVIVPVRSALLGALPPFLLWLFISHFLQSGSVVSLIFIVLFLSLCLTLSRFSFFEGNYKLEK